METYSDAIVVVKDGKVVYERFLNGMTPNQPHQMMSVTKYADPNSGIVHYAIVLGFMEPVHIST